MKKFIAVLLTFTLLLTLCACAQSTSSMREVVTHEWDSADLLYPQAIGPIVLRSGGFSDGKSLLLTDKPVTSIDLSTNEITIFCALPDGEHNSKDCQAYDLPTTIFTANGKIYSLEETGDDEHHLQSLVYVRPASGGEGKCIGTIDGGFRGVSQCCFHVLLYGNSAWILSRNFDPFVENNKFNSFTPGTMYLAEIDLVTDEIKQQITLPTYDQFALFANAWFTGAYGGGIYLMAVSWPPDYDMKDSQILVSQAQVQYYRLDLLTGELENADDEETPGRPDGYPDEFPGPIAPNTFMPDYQIVKFLPDISWHSLRAVSIFGDWLVYSDETLKAYNLKTGEKHTITEEKVYSICVDPAQVNQAGSSFYYKQQFRDTFQYRYDFETGETTQVSLAEGKMIYQVLGETGQYLYAKLSNDSGPVARINISDGFKDCEWEEIS